LKRKGKGEQSRDPNSKKQIYFQQLSFKAYTVVPRNDFRILDIIMIYGPHGHFRKTYKQLIHAANIAMIGRNQAIVR
jgi:hypothetical protein